MMLSEARVASDRRRRWQSPWVFYPLQWLATFAAILALLELWAWVFPPSDKTVWPTLHDGVIGSRFQPNAFVRATNGLDFNVATRSNELGFLDRPPPRLEKPANGCRIAFIGDSFVEAAQVPIEQKLQVVFEHKAQALSPSRKLETMAFGFSGTGQLNQLPYYDHFAKPRRPDVVVLVFVSNDFANNSALLEGIRNGWHPKHTPRLFARETEAGMSLQPIDPAWRTHRIEEPADARPWLHAKLHDGSRFYRWLHAKISLRFPGWGERMGQQASKSERSEHKARAILALDPAYPGLMAGFDLKEAGRLDEVFIHEGALPPAFAQALRFTDYAFGEFQARAKADGAHLVVMASHDVSGAAFGRVRTMLAARGIPFLPLRPFIAARGEPIAKAHWRHDNHWSPQGHQWAAEMLLAHFERERLCDGSRKTTP